MDDKFINNIDFSDTLSETEFLVYFNKFKNGDYSALDMLVKSNIKLVYWYIDNYILCTGNEYDDIFSVSCEALVESLYRYDINKGVKFSTFLITCIRNKILKYFRNEKKYKNIISLDEFMYEDDDLCYKDLIIDSNYSFEDEIMENDLFEYRKMIIGLEIDKFNEIDKEILMLYFGFLDNMVYGQSEIARKLGISQSYVSKRLTRILKYLKNILMDEDSKITNCKLVKKIA